MNQDEVMRRSITRQIKKAVDDMRDSILKITNERLNSMQYQITEFRSWQTNQINLLTERLWQIADYENKLIDEINEIKKNDT